MRTSVNLLLLVTTLFLSGRLSAQPSVAEFDKKLAEFAVNMNKQMPMMGEEPFRMDSVGTAPGKIIIYYYTIMNSDSLGIDYVEGQKLMEQHLIEKVKTNPKMKAFRDNDVITRYYYLDEHGVRKISVEIPNGKYK